VNCTRLAEIVESPQHANEIVPPRGLLRGFVQNWPRASPPVLVSFAWAGGMIDDGTRDLCWNIETPTRPQVTEVFAALLH
jgi:hypothetical protein